MTYPPYQEPMQQSAYIRNCAPACYGAGVCQLTKNKGILAQAQELVREGRRYGMSQALWCDEGDHAFSARDRGRTTITVKGLDEHGEEVSEERTVCSQHRPQMRSMKAIPGKIDNTGSGE